MRLLIAAALSVGICLPAVAHAAPQAGPTTSQRLAQCDKIKTTAARQECRKKVLATKPSPARKQSAQRKAPAKKPTQTVSPAPTATSTM